MEMADGSQLPGFSVLTKGSAGTIRQFYTGCAIFGDGHYRGLDLLSPVLNILGRDVRGLFASSSQRTRLQPGSENYPCQNYASRLPIRPARSCTYCQATRPERLPRVTAHSAASLRRVSSSMARAWALA